MNETDKAFYRIQEIHNAIVEEWIKGKDNAISTLSWFGTLTANLESNWRDWFEACDRRKALRACRKLKKQIAKTQNAVYDFMAYAL